MMESAITPRTKVIILNSPNNPSGAVMSPEDLTAIVRLAHERGIYVIADECYVYLNFTGRRFSAGSLTDAKERLMIIGSLSKTYAMTGWRLGYALGPAAIITAMKKLQSQSTSNPTSIVQKAAVAALNGPQDCVKEMLRGIHPAARPWWAGCARFPACTAHAEGAFYAYPNVWHSSGAGGMNSACRCGHAPAARGPCGHRAGRGFGTSEHIRLSYATSPSEMSAAWSACGSSSRVAVAQ